MSGGTGKAEPRKGPALFEGKSLPRPAQGQGDIISEFDPMAQDEQVGTTSGKASGRARGQRAAGLLARRMGPLARLFWAAVAGLVALLLGAMAVEALEVLFAMQGWLGMAALVLAAIIAGGLVMVALREILGLIRLGRIDRLRRAAEDALASADRTAALAVSQHLARMYRARPELAAAAQRLTSRYDEWLDADTLLHETEATLLADLDRQAQRDIETAARQVALVTAVMPLALVDVLATLAINLRMLGRIAAIYGGRSGRLGAWRLGRAVAAHLLATGALAVGDDLLGGVLGGGIVSKASRRFGEGVVNGTLTARIGVLATDMCRPLPYGRLPRPATTALVRRALAGLFRPDQPATAAKPPGGPT